MRRWYKKFKKTLQYFGFKGLESCTLVLNMKDKWLEAKLSSYSDDLVTLEADMKSVKCVKY